MLPLVVCAGVLWADLARPLTQAEYTHVMVQQVVWHEPLSDEARVYYLARGRVLADFLHPEFKKFVLAYKVPAPAATRPTVLALETP